MIGAITVAILSFVIPQQMVWAQVIVDQVKLKKKFQFLILY
jgi:hypothetical protein